MVNRSNCNKNIFNEVNAIEGENALQYYYYLAKRKFHLYIEACLQQVFLNLKKAVACFNI